MGRRGPARARQAGFGLVEVVVSLMLLAIAVVPITHVIVSTENGANALHVRAEAADLATQALETVEYETATGTVPSAGTQTSTEHSGNDAFSVAVTAALVAGTSASNNLCTAGSGQVTSQIWSVSATATWGSGAQAVHVTQSTLVSPTTADIASSTAGEVAVPVYNADDSTLETASPITLAITGTCTLGSGGCGSTPSGETTSETASTGTIGCAVFPNLYAGSGMTYTVTVQGSAGSTYVDPNELSYQTTEPTRTNIAVQPGAVTVVSSPNVVLAPGYQATVNFQTVNFGTQSASSVPPAADLPVSVQSSTLLCTTLAAEVCVLGNGSATGGLSSSPPQTALLFPGPATSPNYTAWAGDAADSEPAYQDASGTAVYGSDVATSFTASSGGSGSVTLPVYPLSLSVTVKSGSASPTALTATDVGGGDSMTLSAIAGGKSATGLPLGQFLLGAVASPSESVTSGGSAVYVWILPTGVCEASAPMSVPCSSPSTSVLSVTVG